MSSTADLAPDQDIENNGISPGKPDSDRGSEESTAAAEDSARLCRLNYDPAQSAAAIHAAHVAWAERFAAPLYPEAASFPNDPRPDRPLRIGYVSGDLRRHPVALFVEPILRAHDRDGFQVYCYANSDETDDLNQHLRSLVPQWRDIAGLSDAALADQIRADAIDILVDLSGHTARNRLLVFARKPAPVQATMIGYVASTGLATMDYRLTDGICDPMEASDPFFTETLYRLPDGFNCYAPPKGLPDPGPLPLAQAGHVTFGSFNNLDKASPAVLDLWARILVALPDARLILKTKSLSEPTVQDSVMTAFQRHGVAPDRVELIEWTATLREHFEVYRRIDIALDPFPYNGTTTTCEALAMGVPVIAMIGDRHAARVSYSILARLGLAGLAAETADEYLVRAVVLAGRPDMIGNLRGVLRRLLYGSRITDATAYTAGLEAAYRAMWQRWCADQDVAA